MVEAYKTRIPQMRDQKAAEPRESAREKLDALVASVLSRIKRFYVAFLFFFRYCIGVMPNCFLNTF